MKKLTRFSAFCLPGGTCVEQPPGLPEYEFDAVLQGGLQLAFLGAIVFTLFLLIYAGILVIVSRGEKQRLEDARNKFTYGLLGLIVVLLAYGITKTVLYFFGLENLV